MKNSYTTYNIGASVMKSNKRKWLIFIVLSMLLFAGFSSLEAQTPVNKDLYLKSGQGLNRVVPTGTTVSSTASLYKNSASIGATTTGTSGVGLGIKSPLDISHTTGINTNRLMLVTIVYDPINGSASSVNKVSYGTQSLTKLDEIVNGTDVKTELWYLLNPASTTDNVSITWTTPTASLQIVAGVTTLYGVDLSDPFGTVVKTTGTASSASINVPSGLGDFIFDVIGAPKATFTSGGSQTTIFNTGTNKIDAGSSYKTGAAGTTSMSWSFGKSTPYAHMGVAVKGFSNDITFTQSPAMCGTFTIKAGQNISIFTHAAVTLNTASGSPLPIVVRLKKNGTTFFTSNSAVNVDLGALNSQGTLTWTGQLSPATDVTFNATDVLSAEFSSDYTSANIRIDYDATGKQSKITLPTTTYININSLIVYNAANPGGTTITQQAVGVTNYIRAVVSDPFGFADITGMDVVITGPSGTSGAATSVATSGCTRTYEFAWTPTVAGTYSIVATAKEGTEGTVTHSSTISSFLIKQPSLTVTKTKTSPASGPYKINDNITYNIAIQNTGLSTLTQLPLQDLYSASCLQYVSSTITPTNISGGAITWNNLGPLTAGSTLNVTLTMKVIGNCDPAANTARVENAKDGLNYVAATQSSTVNINIDQPPAAVADNYCIQGSTALTVLGNDTDPDVVGFLSVLANAALYNVTITTGPTKGAVTVNGDKTIQFNPAGTTPMSEDNTVTFVYRVAEIANPTLYSEATVTVLYSITNSAPTALNDVTSTTTELPVVINVLSNDSDPDGQLQAPTVTIPPVNGSVAVNADKTITYTPYPGFSGTDVFTYQVCDNGCPTPSKCATATVTITVIYANYVCKEGTSTISVSTVPGAESYKWTLPAGATVTSAYTGSLPNPITTGPTINVAWAAVSSGIHNICVEPTNYCGPGTKQCVDVVVNKVALVLTPTQIACNGVKSGSINLAVSGGIAPYIYAWTGPGGYTASVQSPANLAAGTYNVTVTDKYGCTATGSATINAPPSAIVVSGVVVNATNPNADGSIDISVSGGTSPYTYAWSNGATTQDITSLAGGTYSVTITDANGCSVVKYFTVNNVGGPLTISSTLLTHVKCNGESTGAIDIEVIGGTGTYTYSWTRDGGSFTATTQDISSIPAGTYNVTVSSPGYTSVVLNGLVITQPPVLSASATGTNISCNGQSNGSVTVSATGGTAPYTYLWNTGATTQNLTNVGPGSYSVTITDANGCITTAGKSITGPTPLV